MSDRTCRCEIYCQIWHFHRVCETTWEIGAIEKYHTFSSVSITHGDEPEHLEVSSLPNGTILSQDKLQNIRNANIAL